MARRTYRVSAGAVVRAAVGLVVVGALFLFRLYSRADLVGAGLVWTGVGYAVVCALLLTRGIRAATVVTDAGVVVRGLVRDRSLPWPEILHIQETLPGEVEVIIGPDLRRVELPYLNRKQLGEDFATDAGALRVRWEAGRGTDWHARNADLLRRLEQRFGDLARRAETAAARGNAAAGAILAAVVAFLGDMALIISTAESDFADTTLFGLLLWPGLLLLPVAVFLLVYRIGRARG